MKADLVSGEVYKDRSAARPEERQISAWVTWGDNDARQHTLGRMRSWPGSSLTWEEQTLSSPCPSPPRRRTFLRSPTSPLQPRGRGGPPRAHPLQWACWVTEFSRPKRLEPGCTFCTTQRTPRHLSDTRGGDTGRCPCRVHSQKAGQTIAATAAGGQSPGSRCGRWGP